MFIVKHITEFNGAEVQDLYQARKVTFCMSGPFGALELRDGDVLVAALWGGRAYVMTESGRTIDRYDLPSQSSPGMANHSVAMAA